MLSVTSLQPIGRVELVEDVHVERFCVRSDAKQVEVFAATNNRLLVSVAVSPYTHLVFQPLPVSFLSTRFTCVSLAMLVCTAPLLIPARSPAATCMGLHFPLVR